MYTNKFNSDSNCCCFIFSNSLGVGFSIEDNQVLNNSVVLTNTTSSFGGTLYCITAESLRYEPYWIIPDGSYLFTSTPSYEIAESSNADSLVWTSLSTSVTYLKGHYQCIIEDENISHTLNVWIYNHGSFQGIIGTHTYADSSMICIR